MPALKNHLNFVLPFPYRGNGRSFGCRKRNPLLDRERPRATRAGESEGIYVRSSTAGIMAHESDSAREFNPEFSVRGTLDWYIGLV